MLRKILILGRNFLALYRIYRKSESKVRCI
jgi:hypothetical protein